MGKLFIDEVRGIVLDNLSNENFGTKELASQLGLSTSQTLRKVKAAAGKSINQYIRELRLEKAAKLISKTDDTIAEISYQVGFSSPSYFNKAFSKYYGIAPGEYKTKSLKLSDLTATSTEAEPRSSFLSKRFIYAIGLVLIAIIGFVVIKNFSVKKRALPNSIAVLPFKDLSPEDTQWFCDGVSDNILHALAQMKDLSVTSFTSSSTYRDSDKQIPEIAKELGVSYVLEGSAILHNGKIKVIAQLIDANDQHVWSKEYNESFDDVIAVQQNVAQEVLQQLQLTLSPKEAKTLEKYPTKNMEAYNLHLEGRLINQSRKVEDLLRNIDYNKRAIVLDSSFVDAYAEVASSNMHLAIIYNVSSNHQYLKETISYVAKALEIDSNSAKANAVKARLLLGNDWKGSQTYFKKALELNSNDADSYHWYAFYFLTAEEPDLKQALYNATRAKELSPFSSDIAKRYIWILILNEKFEKAKTYIEDYGFLINEFDKVRFDVMSIGYKNKDWQPAFTRAFSKLKENPENAIDWNIILAIGYDQIFIDKKKATNFAMKASTINSNNYDILANYLWMLNKAGFFERSEQVMQTSAFKSSPEFFQIVMLWDFHYHRKDYKIALNLIEEYPNYFYYHDLSRNYAQLGYRRKLDSINKLYFLQNDTKYHDKAYVHAILKERDSMYYYLSKMKYTLNYQLFGVNSSPEFDSYRHEESFKALLREQYIPTDGEQYIPKVEE